jgi:hypothetical protein
VLAFSFEHVFRAPSTAAVFAAYFDIEHERDQDRRLEIAEREVLELEDRAGELRRVCRVVPRRQLPVFIKPFIPGGLHYREAVTWRRAADEISIEVRPSVMRARVEIHATYRLEQIGVEEIHRRYAGEVSVDVALVGGRIERGIVQEFTKSMPVAARCTQDWLDRHVVPARP